MQGGKLEPVVKIEARIWRDAYGKYEDEITVLDRLRMKLKQLRKNKSGAHDAPRAR